MAFGNDINMEEEPSINSMDEMLVSMSPDFEEKVGRMAIAQDLLQISMSMFTESGADAERFFNGYLGYRVGCGFTLITLFVFVSRKSF